MKGENKVKKQRGITLIALVITIIVLLILAGVSISMVIGNNGILNQANQAAVDTKNTSEKEKVELAYVAARTRKLAGDIKSIEELLAEELGNLGVESSGELVTKSGDVLTVTTSRGNSYEIKNDIVTATYSDSGITGGTDILKEMYSVDGITSEDIADTTLFDVSINSCGGEKEAKIKLKSDVMKPTEDNWYKIDISGDKFVIPYEVEFEGEMYEVTEVDLITVGKEGEYGISKSNVPGVKQLIYPNTVKRIIAESPDGYGGEEYLPLESVVLSNQLEEIPDYMFARVKKLTNITIPSSVTSIGIESFYGCTGLTNLTIPSSVTSIGSYAFQQCTGLKNLTIKNGATTGVSTFMNCTSLTNVIIEQGVTSIGASAFYNCTGLTNITIPSSVTSIGSYAFEQCTGLTNITIPSSVTSIGTYTFSGCTGLTNITIPNSVTSIGSRAFSGCTGLTNVTIPSSVTKIGEYAFYKCTGITQIFIPKSVTSMGTSVFGYWTESQTINCEATSKPDGWNSTWNSTSMKAKLNWGVTN